MDVATLDQTIFRISDIRGDARAGLHTAAIQAIVCGIAQWLHGRGVAVPTLFVGHDSRLHSPRIAHDVLCALHQQMPQSSIHFGGLCTTPIAAFATRYATPCFDVSLMITGSHHPPEINGLKLTLRGEIPTQSDLQQIASCAVQAFVNAPHKISLPTDTIARETVHQQYRDFLTNKPFRLDGLRIAIDGGHGSCGIIAPHVLRLLGAEIHELFCVPDGHFPDHHPNPAIATNLMTLERYVATHKLDIGFAFDGDGDRLAVILGGHGRLRMEELLLLLACDIRSQRPDAITAIGDCKLSQVFFDQLHELGIKAMFGKTGRSLLRTQMIEQHALLAGELSGHIFFGDDTTALDDALYAACRFGNFFRTHQAEIGEYIAPFQTVVNTPELYVFAPVPSLQTFFEALTLDCASPEFRKQYGIRDVITVDGLRIVFHEGWVLLRTSTTRAALSCRFEATTQDQLDHYRCLVAHLLRERGLPQLAIDIDPPRHTPTHGTLVQHSNFPSATCAPRHITIWRPPHYATNAYQRYPVLYVHDGQNLFDPATSFAGVDWGFGVTMERLIAEGAIREAIVVGIWNTPERYNEYDATRVFENALSHVEQRAYQQEWGTPKGDTYLAFLVNELKPFIDMHYRTLSDQNNTFLLGSSMGGIISIYGLCEYPHVFGGVAALSTHWPAVAGKMEVYLADHLPPAGTHRLYFDFGTEGVDAPYEAYQQVVDRRIRLAGYVENEDWITCKFDGAEHSEAAWRERLELPLMFLLSEHKAL
ncbi:alpha/beta hydrolase-fold protein [Chrysiogenes arsenatis]|uniref:alpha/beta hydrolase-fold protein n=1 Tax=Chrysiogenes arsenatis TaxID=309797 RepID=UPI0004044B7B|nr:alpha/beta hydrolase-fold protein [Chrysiogenes arsenatis]